MSYSSRLGRRRRTVLVQRPIDEARAEFTTSLSLRNACIAFYDDDRSQHRTHIVVDGPLVSPIVVHGFEERASGYTRLAVVRPALAYDRNSLALCWRAPLGLGVPVSHATSIYHQLFHAVPSWLALREHVAAAGFSDDAPAAAFVPLVFAAAALGHGKPAAPRRWHAWEYSLRALTTAATVDIAAATTRLLRAPCTCFDRFEADARAFNPGARAAAAAVRAFRDAALRHVRVTTPRLTSLASIAAAQWPGSRQVGSDGGGTGVGGSAAVGLSGVGGPSGALSSSLAADLLLVGREGERRTLSNEAALLERLGGLPEASRLARVALEALPLGAQMRLVSEASLLVAVHGQALAWIPFLPADRRTVGAIEIAIMTKHGALNNCYEAWSAALGVRYWKVAGTLTGGCTGGATNRDDVAQRSSKLLSCNVTVNVMQLVGTISTAARATAHLAGAR